MSIVRPDSTSRGAREWAGVLVPVALCLALLSLYRGFAGDDTFIHLQYARNVAEGHGFSFNPGEPSYGSTAPLWTLLVAGAGEALGARYLLAAKALGTVCTVAAVLLFLVLARRLLDAPLAFLATLAFAIDPWLLKWGGSGMETPLSVAIVLGAAGLYLRPATSGAIPASAFLLGIGTLVRPEMAGLFLVMLAARIFVQRRGGAEALLAVFLYVVPILPWALYALDTFGDVLPAAVRVKTDNMPREEILIRTAKIFGATHGVMLLAIAAAAASAVRRGSHERAARDWLAANAVVWGWVIALPLAYLATKSYVASRYLLLCTPFVVLLGFASVQAIGRGPRRKLGLGVALLAITVVASAAIQASVIYPRTRFRDGVDPNLIRVAEWIHDHTAPDALVATNEIGALGYHARRRVVDTAGLVTRESLPYIRERRMPDLIRDTRPDYYVSSGDARTDRQLFVPFRAGMTRVFELPVRRGGSSPLFANPLPVGVYRFDWELLADDTE